MIQSSKKKAFKCAKCFVNTRTHIAGQVELGFEKLCLGSGRWQEGWNRSLWSLPTQAILGLHGFLTAIKIRVEIADLDCFPVWVFQTPKFHKYTIRKVFNMLKLNIARRWHLLNKTAPMLKSWKEAGNYLH